MLFEDSNVVASSPKELSAENLDPFVLQPPKKRKLHLKGAIDNDVQAMVKQMREVGNSILNKSPRDEFQIFGDYVACELRKLADKSYAMALAVAKQKITAALQEAEITRITIDNVIVVPNTLQASKTIQPSSNSSADQLQTSESAANYFSTYK